MGKVAIVCNGAEKNNLYPAFVLGSAAIASGDDVIIFFTPAAAPALVPGYFETVKNKGFPDLIDLVEGIQALGGRLQVCEIILENKDMKVEDLRPGIELVGATSFMIDIKDATTTFSF